jgi:copper(I)-binding protein
MKFIYFTIALTFCSFGYSHDDHDMHTQNKEHKQHNSHDDHGDHGDHGDHEKDNMHQKHSKDLIVIQNPTIKTTPPGITNSAAYFIIKNNGEKDITLIDVASDAAQIVAMHQHVMSNGAMKMQVMESLTIPAKGSASFQPGGNHIMFIGVTNNIKSGDVIDITLSFDNGTKKTISSTAKKQYKAKNKSHQHH